MNSSRRNAKPSVSQQPSKSQSGANSSNVTVNKLKTQENSTPARVVSDARKLNPVVPMRVRGVQKSVVRQPNSNVKATRSTPKSATLGASHAYSKPPAHPIGDSKTVWNTVSTKANPYYATLADPFNVMGVRIPDSINYPSATFTVVKRVTLVATSSGVAGVALGWYAMSGMTNNVGHLIPCNNNDATKAWILGQANTANASVTDVLGSTAASGNIITLDQWQSGTLTIPGLFSSTRLVSAGIACNSTAGLSNLQGVWRAGFAPPNWYNNRSAASPNAIAFDTITSLPDSVESPVNTGDGVTVTYAPQDDHSLLYCQTGDTQDGSFDLEHADLGTLIVAATGLIPNTSVTCLIVLNYEGIPQTNALSFITTSPSMDDPLMLAYALNEIEVTPLAETGTDDAKKVVHEEHPLHSGAIDGENILHSTSGKIAKVDGGAAAAHLQRSERKQVSFLEGIFREFVPLIEKGIKGVVDTIRI